MGRRKVWPPRPHPHAASGQDRVRVDGRDIYLGPIGSAASARAYAALLEQWEKEGRASPAARPARQGLLVGEVLEKWQEYAERRYSKEGREAEQYRYACRPLASVHGRTPVAKFGLVQLDEVRDRMLSAGWCRALVNRRVSRIRTVWRWAEEKGHVPAGSWAALRALRPLTKGDGRAPESPGRKPCSWADLAAVSRQMKPRPRAMLLVLWFSGARPGEVRKMQAGDVDVSGEDWVFAPGAHKNSWRGCERRIVLGPRARKVLAPHLAGKGPAEYVFPATKQGAPYRAENFSRTVQRARERAGVEARVIPYGCRHAAKRRITRELGLDAARAALGQATLTTTDRYAAGGDEELAREVARRLG